MADSKISALTGYTTPLDADVLPIVDTANTATKKVTWANIIATLKTYFDTLYTNNAGTVTSVATGTGLTGGAITGSGTISLSTPLQPIATIASNAGKFLRVNAGESAVEYATITGGGDALTTNPLSQFAATTSLQLKGVISDETGSGALVFADTPTLVTPILGTPTSGTLTNCTALPVAGITSSTSTALGVGSLEIGHASDTTLSRASAGVAAIEGNNIVVNTSSPTLATITTTGNIELGNASDTTISRVSAGKIAVEGVNVGYLEIPQNSQSTAYTTVLADSGKHILHPAGDANARTFTIDSNANVAYPVGTAITFVNMTSQAVTIAITSDTMNLAGAGTTGSRTLAQYGIATAVKITTTGWIISGTNLT